jgi:hypothetical protein
MATGLSSVSGLPNFHHVLGLYCPRSGTRQENAFVTRVLEQPKLWVIGSEHDLPIAA